MWGFIDVVGRNHYFQDINEPIKFVPFFSSNQSSLKVTLKSSQQHL